MWGNSFVDIGMGLPCTMIVSHWGKWISYVELSLLTIRQLRHATCQLTFDPAASACDMPAILSIQRPRHATFQRHFRSSGPVMRHASVTFDPAAPACDMPAHLRSSGPAIELPAALSTQRPRQSSCQRHFRSSGSGNRVASGTFDPAASAIELPATLSTQRPRQSSCQPTFDPAAPATRVAGE